jgi:hypothetical protein
MVHVKSLISELQELELHWICNFPYSVAAFFLSMMVKSTTHGGQEPQLQKIFLTLTMMQVKSLIPEQQEPELHRFVIFLTLLLFFCLSMIVPLVSLCSTCQREKV